MDFRPASIDEFDWSSTPGPPATTSALPPRTAAPEEPAPPPPAPAPERRGRPAEPPPEPYVDPRQPGTDLLPAAYQEARKNIYKRGAPAPFTPTSVDSFNWGPAPSVSGEPAYDPADDWALTRGFKVGADQGTKAITAVGDMARMETLTPKEQVAEMLRIGRQTDDPSAPRLGVEGFTSIGSFSEGMTWLGESAGQMVGSLYAAAVYGGGAGAATGAAVGGAAGLGAGVVGAIPGAITGAVTGAGYGTLAAFGAMGVGGTFHDLLSDKGVQEGLENGTVTPNQVLGWATVAGAAIGAIDALPVVGRFNEITGKKLTVEAVKTTIKKAALAGIGKGALEEGGTEALQGAISEFAQAVVGGNVDLAARIYSVVDQGLAGAVGGAAPGGFSHVVENAGISGPQTGNAPTPPPPVGGMARSTTEAAKAPATGTAAVEVIQPGQAAGDIAAAAAGAGVAEQPNVDPTVAAAAAATQPAAAAQPAEQQAPYQAVSPWPKRQRRAPAEPPVAPVPGAAPPEAPVPPAAPEAAPAPQVTNEAPAGGVLPAEQQVVPPVAEAPVVAPVAQPVAEAPTPPVPALRPVTAPVTTEPTPLRDVSYTPPEAAPEQQTLALPAPPAPAGFITEGPELQALREYAGRLEPYAEAPAMPVGQVSSVTTPLGEKALAEIRGKRGPATKAQLATATAKLRAAHQERLTEAQRKAELRAGKRTKAIGITRLLQPTAVRDAMNRLDELTGPQYEYFYQHLPPEVKEKLPQHYLPKRRFLKRPSRSRKRLWKRESREGLSLTMPEPETPGRAPQSVLPRAMPAPEVRPAPVATPAPTPVPQDLRYTMSDKSHFEMLRKTYPHMDNKWKRMVPAGLRKLKYDLLIKQPTFKAFRNWMYDQTEYKDEATTRAMTLAWMRQEGISPPTAARSVSKQAAAGAVYEAPIVPTVTTTVGRRPHEVRAPTVPVTPLGQKPPPKPAALVVPPKAEGAVGEGAEPSPRRPIMFEDEAIAEALERIMAQPSPEWIQAVADEHAKLSGQPLVDAVAQSGHDRHQEMQSALNNLKTKRARTTRLKATEMEGQVYTTLFRIAKEAYLTDPKDNSSTPLARPDSKLDPVGAIEWEMGKNRVDKARWGQKPQYKLERQTTAARWEQLKAARLAAQTQVDARAARAAQALKDMAEKDRQLHEGYVTKLFDEGKIDDSEAKELMFAYNNKQMYATMKTRTRVSNPVLKAVLDALPRPDPPFERQAQLATTPTGRVAKRGMPKTGVDFSGATAAEKGAAWESMLARRRAQLAAATALTQQQYTGTQVGPRARKQTGFRGRKAATLKGPAKAAITQRNFFAELHEWGTELLARVDAALKEKGVALPTKSSRNNNSPEENAFVFLRQVINDINALKRGEITMQRGQSLADAWGVMKLVEEQGGKLGKGGKGLEAHDRWFKWYKDVGDLYAQMFDSPDAMFSEKSLEARMASAAQAEFDRWQQAQLEEPTAAATEIARIISEDKSSTALADRIRQAWGLKVTEDRNKILESPTRVAARAAGGAIRSLTGGGALDEFGKHWDYANTVLGRTLLKGLKALVGDVPVHFIPHQLMQELQGGSPAGAYSPQAHMIVMHNELADFAGKRAVAGTLVHEMIHAATAHAINNNIRGTADILNRLLGMVRQRAAGPPIPGGALSSTHEFITQALESGNYQDYLKSLPIDVSERAAIRALSRGRLNASMWDYVVAAIENALGTFTPWGQQRSFLDPILSLHPQMMTSSAERQADLDTRADTGLGDPNAILSSPFDVASYPSLVQQAIAASNWRQHATDWKVWGRQKYHRYLAPMENIRKDIAERFFSGDYDNPLNAVINAYLEHPRLLEEEMQQGDVLSQNLIRWVNEGDYVQRWEQLGDGLRLLLESSLDHLDARKPGDQQPTLWDDAKHPTKKPRKGPTKRHQRDAPRRVLAQRYHDGWVKLDPELQQHLSARADYMIEQMAKYKRKTLTGLLRVMVNRKNNGIKLPQGYGSTPEARITAAVTEIMSGKISPALKGALKDNYDTVVGSTGKPGMVGKWFQENRLYFPTHREGDYFIAGRKDIPIPEGATFDKATFDKRGVFQIRFSSMQAANDYVEQQGGNPDGERIIDRKTEFANPITGKKTNAKDHGRIKGVDWEAQPVEILQLQDRFMTMGNSVGELNDLAAELRAEGYEVGDPASMLENQWAEKALMPGQLSSMLRSIDSSEGISPTEKKMVRTAVTNHYARQQQGGRITKRLMRRKAVAGYSEGTKELMQSLNTNNEMMSRTTVGIDRMEDLNKAVDDARNYIDAAARPTDRSKVAKLPSKWRDQVLRDYPAGGNKAAMLSDDFKQILTRAEASMMPSGVRFLGPGGEQTYKSIMTMVVLSYLFKPAYFAVQMLGLPMQSLPPMIAEMTKTHGFSAPFAAKRYMGKAFADVSGWRNYGKGLQEAAAETKQFVDGFKPRGGFIQHGRFLRKQHDHIAQISQDISDSETTAYKSAKLEAIRRARQRGIVGQAGLEQPNLRLDLMGSGIGNKMARAIDQQRRVFTAIQEGIEVNNRLVPMLGYLEYFLDQGIDENTAIEKAVNNMAREQVSYAKGNRPAWMSNPVFQPFLMFRWFGIQQAINYYQSLRRVFGPTTSAADRTYAMVHLMGMTAMLAAVGGMSGNPLWEPIRFLMYLFGLSDNWDVSKTKGEQWMAQFIGPTASEMTMYGLPRAVGIDLSSRVAMDTSLFYQQPKEMTQQAWLQVIGQMAGGAPVSTAFSTWSAIAGATGDQSTPKWLSQLPFPGTVKDILKAYDTAVNGPTTATGVHTAKPPPLVESIIQGATGIRTRSQSRPFEQGSAAQQRVKQVTSMKRSALVQRILNQGYTASNAAKVRDWNASQTDRKMRIKMHDITLARKRRRKMETSMQKANLEAA